jgi:hypothetical protein
MTARKKLPHAANWALDDSIADAMQSVSELSEAAQKINDPAVLRIIIAVMKRQHNIQNRLKECKGAENER